MSNWSFKPGPFRLPVALLVVTTCCFALVAGYIVIHAARFNGSGHGLSTYTLGEDGTTTSGHKIHRKARQIRKHIKRRKQRKGRKLAITFATMLYSVLKSTVLIVGCIVGFFLSLGVAFWASYHSYLVVTSMESLCTLTLARISDMGKLGAGSVRVYIDLVKARKIVHLIVHLIARAVKTGSASLATASLPSCITSFVEFLVSLVYANYGVDAFLVLIDVTMLQVRSLIIHHALASADIDFPEHLRRHDGGDSGGEGPRSNSWALHQRALGGR